MALAGGALAIGAGIWAGAPLVRGPLAVPPPRPPSSLWPPRPPPSPSPSPPQQPAAWRAAAPCGVTASCAGACRDGRCCLFGADPACGGAAPPPRRRDFNRYILRAVELLYRDYRGRGYDINSAFTHDLDYSRPGEIKAGPRAPATMCVAAVSEVIITALKLYADDRHDRSVFDKLPARSWTRSTPLDIRPYMFLHGSVDSSGTADALARFGIGEHRPFPALAPGDFISFNRLDRSGHAVVFMGYLNAQGQIEPAYDARRVVGFKYFSAQGAVAPYAGLGYRWAFFGRCPSWREAGKPRDCGVIPSDNPRLFNTGYMLAPSQWTTASASLALRSALIGRRRQELLARRLPWAAAPAGAARLPLTELRRLEQEATRALTVELPPASRLVFDGRTTDD